MSLIFESMAFADRLREIMDARGVDQTLLAEKVGVTSQAVSQWVSRIRPVQPRGKRLADIASVLRVTVPALMAGQGEPFDDIDNLRPKLLARHEEELINALRTAEPARAKAILTLFGIQYEDGRPNVRKRSKGFPSPRPFVGGDVKENLVNPDCGKVVPIDRQLHR